MKNKADNMTNQKSQKNKKYRYLKKLGIIIITLIALTIIAIITITRPFFLKKIILPKISKQLNTPITVEQISLQPLSKIKLTKLCIGEKNNPFLKDCDLTCNYKLIDILLKNKLTISGLTITNATLYLTEDANGKLKIPTNNHSSHHQKQKKDSNHPKTNLPPILNLTNINLNNLNLIYTQNKAKQNPTTIKLSNINLRIPSITSQKKVETSNLTAKISIKNKNITIKTADLNIPITFTINEKLLPQQITASIAVNNIQGQTKTMILDNHTIKGKISITSNNNIWSINPIQIQELDNNNIQSSLTITGNINQNSPQAKLQIAVTPINASTLNILGAITGDYNFGKTSGQYNAELTISDKQLITIKGSMKLKNITIQNNQQNTKKLPKYQLQITHNGTYSLKQKTTTIKKLDLYLTQNKHQIIALSLSSPWILKQNTNNKPNNTTQSNFNIKIEQFDLTTLNAFYQNKNQKIIAGHLNTNIQLQLQEFGKNIQASGIITINNLQIQNKKQKLPPFTIKQDLPLELTNYQQISIQHAATEIIIDNQIAMKMRNNIDFNLKNKTGIITTNLVNINEKLISLLINKNKQKIQNLIATGKMTTQIGKNKQITNKGELTIKSLNITNHYQQNINNLNSTLKFEQTINDKQLTINKFKLNLKQNATPILNLNINGKIAKKILTGKSNLNITSQTIDLKALQQIQQCLNNQPTTQPQPYYNYSQIITEPKQKQEPKPLPYKKLDLTINLNLQNVTYDKINMQECKGFITYQQNKLIIPIINIKSDEATAQIKNSWIDFNQIGYQYNLHTHIENLEITPFVATLKPKIQPHLVGNIKQIDIKTTGKGITINTLKKRMKTTIIAKINNLSLKNFETLAQTARERNIPELAEINFNKGDIELQITDGICNFKQFIFSGINQQVTLEGDIDLDQNINLITRFAVGGTINQRLRKRKVTNMFKTNKNGYVLLPSNLPISGTLKKPKANWQKFVLATLGAGALQKKLKTDSKTTGLLIDGISGLIENKEDQKEKSTEQLIQGLFNLGIQELERKQKKKQRKKQRKKHK